MIKGLKIKFTILVSAITLIIMTVLVSTINVINYDRIIRNADEILSIISENGGSFPEVLPDVEGGEQSIILPNISPELPYESRYFIVAFDEKGNLLLVDTRNIAAINGYDAYALAREALQKDSDVGFIGEYRYMLKVSEEGHRTYTFLSCERLLSASRNFLLTSIVTSILIYAAVVTVSAYFAERIVRPIVDSYEKQKRFITDAGHELKTPLTVISANVDILKMEIGDNECLDDIRQQTSRLTTLTNDLVYLARMEERPEELIEIPISDIVEETAIPYKNLAKASGKEMRLNIAPMLSLRANSKSVQQLVAILLDNAIKYSSDGGEIEFSLQKTSRGVIISAINTVDEALDKNSLSRIFDRFYRHDPSRSSRVTGNGIGLSIAIAVAKNHSGRMDARMISDNKIEIIATLNN